VPKLTALNDVPPCLWTVAAFATWEANMSRTAERERTVDYEATRTRNHETIRNWAEARGGHPAVVEGTEILRIDFDDPDESADQNLRRISWDEFFRIFDSRDLEFLYQERTHDGKVSRFNKFVTAGSDDEDR
jgi:hypothetical protein